MKKLVTVEEVNGEGLQKLMGENVLLMCANYFYSGTLIGVNDQDVLLKDAKIVYETGEWNKKTWQDAQDLPSEWYVKTASIESFGKSGR